MVKKYEPPKHPYRFCQCEEDAFEIEVLETVLRNPLAIENRNATTFN